MRNTPQQTKCEIPRSTPRAAPKIRNSYLGVFSGLLGIVFRSPRVGEFGCQAGICLSILGFVWFFLLCNMVVVSQHYYLRAFALLGEVGPMSTLVVGCVPSPGFWQHLLTRRSIPQRAENGGLDPSWLGGILRDILGGGNCESKIAARQWEQFLPRGIKMSRRALWVEYII